MSSKGAAEDKQKASKPFQKYGSSNNMFHLGKKGFKYSTTAYVIFHNTKNVTQKAKSVVTSTCGGATPRWVETCFVKRLNFGLRAFAAGPPLTPNSINLTRP